MSATTGCEPGWAVVPGAVGLERTKVPVPCRGLMPPRHPGLPGRLSESMKPIQVLKEARFQSPQPSAGFH
jgi:hypothetical protein